MASPIELVKPGDLITADLMNRLILLLNQHDLLLSATGSPISITNVQPPVLRVGEELKVFGSGLDAANLKQISIESTNVPISALKLGSGGGLLVFDVPALLVPPTGKTATITVENKSGVPAFGSVYVLPAVAENLEASFTMTRTTVTPAGALAAGTPYEFTFSIQAFSSRAETYVLQPTLTGAPADWSAAMKNGQTEILIPKSQPVPSTTPVVVVVTTGAAGGGTLSLGLRAKNFPGVSGSSMTEGISIGAAPGAVNTDVQFMSPTVLGSVQKFTNGSLYIRIDSTASNQRATVNPLNVQLAQPGVYSIGAPAITGAPAGAWTVTITNNPQSFDTSGTPNAVRGITFDVSAAAGAPDADLSIPVVGAGALPSGTFTCKLKLRTDPSNPNPV